MEQQEKCIQLDDDMLANKISLRVFLKLPSIQTYFCKTLLKLKTGEASIVVAKGQFAGPRKLDDSVLPLVQLAGVAAAELRDQFCCGPVRTVPQAALLPAAIC